MFDIGFQEMVLIMVLALLVFGPSKLPELGKMIGRAMREFRKASDEFRTTVETNLKINEIDDPPPPIYPDSTPAADVSATPAPAAEYNGAATETAETAVAAVVDEGDPFYAQRGSPIFHSRQCTWASRIEEANRVYFKKVAEGRDQGFKPCPACEPWEPA
jgi:Tat protein translocase TatB subunit